MKTNAPKSATWLIGTILGVLGIAGNFKVIAALAGTTGDYMLIAGFAILALGSVLKGM